MRHFLTFFLRAIALWGVGSFLLLSKFWELGFFTLFPFLYCNYIISCVYTYVK
nr:MAG TPA_asm: hypothetical protein [Caudoviricetes sp.]